MGTTRLTFAASVEEQWQEPVGPWLREMAVAAWKNSKLTVILTPSRAESFYLRSRLVAEDVSFLGLRFWTPSDARKFLLAELSPELESASQAELRLVARVCAENLARQSTANDLTLTSVIREPGAFLRAYDLLLGAGWDPAREGAIYGRHLAREFQCNLESHRIATQAGLHRELCHQISSQTDALVANLLVVGFNATHWPLWDVLKAAVFAAEGAVVALLEPRVFAEEIDQLWISSWEEVTGTECIGPVGEIVEDDRSTPFSDLAASYEQGVIRSIDSAELSFRVTSDLASHVRAVTLQALEYLKGEDCTRLGIVFPEADALALGVAEELRRLEIPLDDGTGSLTPGPFERRCWRTWVALQEEPGVQRLLAWVRACEAQGVSSGMSETLSARSVADVIEGALADSLVDNLDFLASHLEANGKGHRSAEVAEFLRARVTLPEKGTFADFLAVTRQALALRGWEKHVARLQIDPPEWLLTAEEALSRRTFLEWLKESTDSQVRTRGSDGNHFYGKVHLLIYAQMTGQTWSHLILTGLNEGIWPRVFEMGAFGSRHELVVLNRQARALNVRGTMQGRQGSGQEIVAPGKGHCLLPLERQELGLRDLCAALEGTGAAVCLTSLTTESGRSLLPSDFFSHAYQAKTGVVLDEEAFRRVASATESWCREYERLFESEPEDRSTIVATKTAYAARRDSTRPFGPYEFAFAEPPPRPVQLSCKEWEDAWNHPSSVWLEKVVGTAPWPEGTLSWPRAVGTWAHRWLAAALRDFQGRGSILEFPVLLSAAASRDGASVRNLARGAGMDLYPWWEQVWHQARTVALGLAETLAPHLQDRKFLCEFRLPRDVMIPLPSSDRSDFLLKGRIDLLLIEPGAAVHDLEQGNFTGCVGWVIDFKTGSAQSLNAKKIGEGKGLQAILYAMAVRALGAVSTAISIHTPEAVLKQQVWLDDILEITPLFRSLETFHQSGIFGMRADADNEYGYSPAYPLATRFIPGDVLTAKWALLHGVPSTEESE